MAAPGWYPDANEPGTLRWWDGSQWSDHTMAAQAATPPPAGTAAPVPPAAGQNPVPPAPMPKLRADGSGLKGPTFRASMVVLLGGLVLVIASSIAVVPAFLDSVNGPRFDTPGSHTLDLGEGTWVLYERTGTSSGSGGIGFDANRGVSIGPGNVTVDGPGAVEVRSDVSGLTQTITRGSATYTGAVRIEVVSAGAHTITVEGAGGEVLVARPITDLFSLWPWLVAFILGGLAVIAGVVMWIIGASNRRAARRAGFTGV